MGGGGGGSATTSSSLPDWAQPYAQGAVEDAVSLEDAGAFSHVQDLSPEQLDAFSRKAELGQRGGVLEQIAADSYGAGQAYRDAASGQGLFGSDALGQQAQALEGTIGRAQAKQLGNLSTQASLGGGLGSARSEAGINRALTDTAGNIASKELAARRGHALEGAGGVIGSGGTIQDQFGSGVRATESVGSALQQQGQNEGDAAYQGVQRLFGLLGSGVAGQKQVTTQSGGK